MKCPLTKYGRNPFDRMIVYVMVVVNMLLELLALNLAERLNKFGQNRVMRASKKKHKLRTLLIQTKKQKQYLYNVHMPPWYNDNNFHANSMERSIVLV